MRQIKTIRALTLFFIAGLFISGLTCFPIPQEIEAGKRFFFNLGYAEPDFIIKVFNGVTETQLNEKHIII